MSRIAHMVARKQKNTGRDKDKIQLPRTVPQ